VKGAGPFGTDTKLIANTSLIPCAFSCLSALAGSRKAGDRQDPTPPAVASPLFTVSEDAPTLLFI
jgi:hypothetical protein